MSKQRDTPNSALKRKARVYANKHGVAYVEALRVLRENCVTTRDLPSQAPYPFEVTPDPDRLPFGVAADEVTLSLAAGEHLLVSGSAGSGKTSLLSTLAFGALSARQEVHVLALPRSGIEFGWAGNRLTTLSTEPADWLRTVEALHAQVGKARRLAARHDAPMWSGLPGWVRPTSRLLIVDELRWLHTSEVPDELSSAILAIIVDLIRDGRAAGITVVVSDQRFSHLVDLSSVKQVMSRALFGPASSAVRCATLRDPESTPVIERSQPRGRGIYESAVNGDVSLFQALAASPEEYRRHLL